MKATKSNNFYLAVATLVGTIIGVGIFGVPYAMSQVGLVLALVYLVVLGGIQLLQSLFYAEAAMACKEKIRLIGLTGKFIGPQARHVAAVATILGFWAGIIAYILVGGTFLHLILSPLIGGELLYYQIGWGVVGGLIVYFGLNFVEKIDFISTIALGLALLLIVVLSVQHQTLSNLVLFTPGDYFLPYGVILFSLSGLSAIPEMEDIMKGRHAGFRRAIIIGSLIATGLTALFALAVYGVTGLATTADAVSGLKAVMGGGITVFAALFGFLAVATSYFIIALNLKSSFEYDYKMHRWPAWLLACGVPIGLVIIGIKNFIGIISFSGAVFGGITAVIVSWLYISITRKNILKKSKLGVSLIWAYITIVVLSLGAIYEVFVTLF
ncbi:amino acid permease [Patescibacteria group bacterium]|nr:amino acid permease [Patescibacteria group bacterium]MBU1029003.1 amino acid permease [Patescibacteria group bacterium]